MGCLSVVDLVLNIHKEKLIQGGVDSLYTKYYSIPPLVN